ncbi:MAG TPA: hypothetical protein GX503_07800 [Clostridiales bacterium]|nr:hypothetical protein [Clostridiales bacterium]
MIRAVFYRPTQLGNEPWRGGGAHPKPKGQAVRDRPCGSVSSALQYIKGFAESASGSNKRFEKSSSSKFLKILPLPIGRPVQRQRKQRPAVFTDFLEIFQRLFLANLLSVTSAAFRESFCVLQILNFYVGVACGRLKMRIRGKRIWFQ